MNKIIVTLAVSTLIHLNAIAAAAPPVAANKELTITPKVTLDSGYTTRANHLGLQIQ